MPAIKRLLTIKPIYILIGLINIVVFHYAIYRLFTFLYQTPQVKETNLLYAMIINFKLILFFSIPHSVLLNAKVKTFFFQYIPKALYPTLYSLHACIGIILMDKFWISFGSDFYILTGNLKYIMNGLYVFGWLFMAWSMIATGPLRQNGIEEWWLGLKGKTMKRSLLDHGPYRICRHPIYASFLAMIWFTPNMTFDHLFLSLAWSFYIIVGASYKESRLRRNKKYQEYSKNVPAFPFMPISWDSFLTYKIWRKA